MSTHGDRDNMVENLPKSRYAGITAFLTVWMGRYPRCGGFLVAVCFVDIRTIDFNRFSPVFFLHGFHPPGQPALWYISQSKLCPIICPTNIITNIYLFCILLIFTILNISIGSPCISTINIIVVFLLLFY